MILRSEAKDYGGVEVWDDRQPDSPIYLAPHLLPEYYADGQLTAAGQVFVERVILDRLESQEQADGLYAE